MWGTLSNVWERITLNYNVGPTINFIVKFFDFLINLNIEPSFIYDLKVFGWGMRNKTDIDNIGSIVCQIYTIRNPGWFSHYVLHMNNSLE